MTELVERLRKRYAPKEIGPCNLCGAPRSIAQAGGGTIEWVCSEANSLKRPLDWDNDHYGRSKVIQTQFPDDDVMALIAQFEALASSSVPEPIPMLLHCPKCGLQHIDEPDERTPEWDNPPHRSHLCHGCGCIWRPADVATNGVASIETVGKADTWAPQDRGASQEDGPTCEKCGGTGVLLVGGAMPAAVRCSCKSAQPSEPRP